VTEEPCRFDDSLPRFVAILSAALGPPQLAAGVVLRDATGRLCFVTSDEISPELVAQIEQRARDDLGHYARAEVVVSDDGDTFDLALQVDVAIADSAPLSIRYLDRRIVGADWLRRPEPERAGDAASAPVRVVFSSLKGGVGRSTALTVVAAEQARRGRHVLVLDLDLEAPGVGSLLLSVDRTPRYGVVDYLVERNFGPVDPEIVGEMVGTSELTQGQGLVHVVPAVGSRTLEEPAGYLAKLSRAMLEAITGETPMSLADKLRELVHTLEQQRRYDLILIDARAGLAEIAAGPILALDAEVLIFGTSQRQTIDDLTFLFAHLGTLGREIWPSPWGRLKMVHAKAAQAATAKQHREALWELFAEHLYVETLGLEELNFDAESTEAPHYPITIPLDLAFADWDPVHATEQLVTTYYTRTYGDLISYVEDLLESTSTDDQE
jgi:Mrp family chromosome partitioning ATPase